MSSAARGALAGLIGGVVLTAAHRMVLPKLAGRSRRSRGGEANDPLGMMSKRAFADLSPRARNRATIATQLAGAAMLGAAYGIAVEHLHSSRAGRNLIDAALIFGASLIAPELAPSRSRRRGRKVNLRRRALAPLTGPTGYGRTTSAALRLLAG
jgi:hypothetical protein